MLLAARALGLLVGLVIGALGGGGSVLTVPLLVFVLGLSAQDATGASLVIVGVASLIASLAHARSGHTRWGTALMLAAAGVPASVLGTRLNRGVEEDVLLLSFSALLLLTAVGMLLRTGHGEEHAHSTAPGPSSPTARTGLIMALRLVAAGLAVGFLTGFLGVGGGFLVVPVLVLAMHLEMSVAVGTSLLVIAANCAVALGARAGQDTFDLGIVVPFTLGAVAASLVGKHVADRLPTATLTRAFAALLLGVAGYVGVRAAAGLT